LGKLTITGLTMERKVAAFTGEIQSVEAGSTAITGYPLRITMADAEFSKSA
jgi:hypothetical protein